MPRKKKVRCPQCGAKNDEQVTRCRICTALMSTMNDTPMPLPGGERPFDPADLFASSAEQPAPPDPPAEATVPSPEPPLPEPPMPEPPPPDPPLPEPPMPEPPPPDPPLPEPPTPDPPSPQPEPEPVSGDAPVRLFGSAPPEPQDHPDPAPDDEPVFPAGVRIAGLDSGPSAPGLGTGPAVPTGIERDRSLRLPSWVPEPTDPEPEPGSAAPEPQSSGDAETGEEDPWGDWTSGIGTDAAGPSTRRGVPKAEPGRDDDGLPPLPRRR